jgi:hypothetical protein
MIEETEAQKKYLAGYEAFEQGDLNKAITLANSCMALSSETSYWYAGALGLKCWVANFANNLVNLEWIAATLLTMDTGFNKAWFDGVALLNLGLAMRKTGNMVEAQTLFLQAAERYSRQPLQPEQPSEWQYVLDYFSTLCKWAATEDVTLWEEILDHYRENDKDGQSILMYQLTTSAQLMHRYAQGHEVKQEAVELVKEGISRTFLAVLLME